MSDVDYEDEAEDITETLAEHDIPDEAIDHDDIVDRLETMHGDYQVPLAEARRSAIRHYADEHDVEIEGYGGGGGDGGGSEKVDIGSIDTADNWVAVEGTVTELWDSDSDAIRQAGLIGDETGRIKFVSWEKSDLDMLEEGETYRLENVITDEYQGRMSVNMNSSTEIEQLDEDIEAADSTEVKAGALIDFQSGSGLIKRCDIEEDCTRVVQNGRCSEHGEADGEFDLRIKGVLDNGEEVQEVLFDREMTEEVTGVTLDEAKDEAKQALDTTVVEDTLAEGLLGRYYRMEGPVAGRYLLVNECDRLDPDADANALLDRAEAM